MQKLALEVNETQYFYKYAEEVSIASFLFDFVAEVLFKVCLLDKKNSSEEFILSKLLEYDIFDGVTTDVHEWVKYYKPISIFEANLITKNLKKACIKELFEYLDFSDYKVELRKTEN